MKLLIAIFVSVSLGALSPPTRPPSCADRFRAVVDSPQVRNSENPVTREEFLYREHVKKGRPYHEVLVVEDFDSPYDVFTRVTHREVREGKAPSSLHTDASSPLEMREAHLKLANSIVKQNVGIYENRTNWDAQGRKGFEDMASEFLDSSVYVEVYHKPTGTRVSGKRYILAPYGLKKGELVPEGYLVRKYFGPVEGFLEPGEKQAPHELPKPPRHIPESNKLEIALPRPTVAVPGDPAGVSTGMHVEYGTLFVEKTLKDGTEVSPELRAQIHAEMHLQDMRMFFSEVSDELNYLAKTTHAYADPPHARLYTRILGWGWDLLRNYIHKGKRVEFEKDEDAPTIAYGGTNWVPIVFHPERLETYHQRFLEGDIPHAKWVQLRERQQALGQNLKGAEVIDSVNFMTAGFHSEDPRVVTGSIFGLVRLARRHELLRRKVKEAQSASSKEWKVPRETKALDPVPERLRELIDSLGEKTSPEDKLYLLMLGGALAEENLTDPRLSRATLCRKLFFPLMKDPDFNVRSTACAYLTQHFTPHELLNYLSKEELKKDELNIDKLLRHRKFQNPLFTDMARSLEIALNPRGEEPPSAQKNIERILARTKASDRERLRTLLTAGVLTNPGRRTKDEASLPRNPKERARQEVERQNEKIESARQVQIDFKLFADREMRVPIQNVLAIIEEREPPLPSSLQKEKELLVAALDYIEAHEALKANDQIIHEQYRQLDKLRKEQTNVKDLEDNIRQRIIENNRFSAVRNQKLAAYALKRAEIAAKLGNELEARELTRLATARRLLSPRDSALYAENRAYYEWEKVEERIKSGELQESDDAVKKAKERLIETRRPAEQALHHYKMVVDPIRKMEQEEERAFKRLSEMVSGKRTPPTGKILDFTQAETREAFGITELTLQEPHSPFLTTLYKVQGFLGYTAITLP